MAGQSFVVLHNANLCLLCFSSFLKVFSGWTNPAAYSAFAQAWLTEVQSASNL